MEGWTDGWMDEQTDKGENEKLLKIMEQLSTSPDLGLHVRLCVGPGETVSEAGSVRRCTWAWLTGHLMPSSSPQPPLRR